MHSVDITNEIVAKLQAAFEASGMDQQALAKAAGVQQSLISRYFRRESAPKLETTLQLASALGLGIDELLAQPTPAPRIVTPSPLEALEIVRKALQAPGLSKDEEDILAAYRALTPDGKRSLLKTAVAMPKAPAAKKSDRETG
jgi:transcriptional regulator with XRE-family HTH domain